MEIALKIKKAENLIKKAKKENKIIAFIPTMGALHSGHMSLIKKAKEKNSYRAVSIFINPLQFGPNEDLKKYPRNFKADKKLLKEESIDLLFYPKAREIYPSNFSTQIQENYLSQILCGKTRPGHFQGVCTIVVKLLNIISPDLAYFGQKDYQQALIIKKIVSDLNLRTKIKIASTKRESNGLAFSSRNAYLNKKERDQSRCLYQALIQAKKMINSGQKKPEKIISEIKNIITANHLARIDYIEIRNAKNLEEIKEIRSRVFIGIAVFFGKTRLIDNIIVRSKK